MSLNYRNNNNIVKNIDICINEINKLDTKFKNILKDTKNNIFMKKDLNINNNKIKFIGKGGQGIVYLFESNDCGSLVFKISRINSETTNEIYFLKRIKHIIDDNISPNFIYSYKQITVNNYYYSFYEHADGDLEEWLQDDHSEEEWISFMFQVLQGIYVLQKELRAYHADLKPKNILYKKIRKGFLKYIIEDNEFYVPTCGYLFLIGDLGKTQSLLLKNNILDNNSIETFIKDNADLDHIESLPKRILVSALEKKYINNINNFLRFMDQFGDIKFEKYYNSEKEKINFDLSKYPEYIKTKMLLRSIIYYAIEKKYININDIDKIFFTMKYPPHTISKKLEELFSLKIPIIDILNRFDYYKEKPNSDNIIKIFKI